MRRYLFLGLVTVLSFVCGVVANSFTRPRTPAPEARSVPVTKIAIEPNAPISIGVITKATAHVFNIEIVNVSGKAIQGFAYTSYKQCGSTTIPAGGGVWFIPEKSLKPGEKTTLVASEEDRVRETDFQNCIDTMKEIRLQIKTVTFADGSIWTAVPGDFPGIKSSSP